MEKLTRQEFTKEFKQQMVSYEVVVSDLTYVRVGNA